MRDHIARPLDQNGIPLADVEAFDLIEIVEGCWSTPLDPRMPPDQRKSGDYTNSRAIFYAVRPYTWRDQFPKVSQAERELRREVVEKYRSLLPFPPV